MIYKDLVMKLSIEQRNNFDGFSAKGNTAVEFDISESKIDIKNVHVSCAFSSAFMSVIEHFTSKNGFDQEQKEVFYQDVIGKMHETNINRKKQLAEKSADDLFK